MEEDKHKTYVAFEGIVHPEAKAPGYDGLWLTRENMEKELERVKGRPLHYNHDTAKTYGKIVDARIDEKNRMIARFQVELSPETVGLVNEIRQGKCGGLSLGMTHLIHETDSDLMVIDKEITEISATPTPDVEGMGFTAMGFSRPGFEDRERAIKAEIELETMKKRFKEMEDMFNAAKNQPQPMDLSGSTTPAAQENKPAAAPQEQKQQQTQAPKETTQVAPNQTAPVVPQQAKQPSPQQSPQPVPQNQQRQQQTPNPTLTQQNALVGQQRTIETTASNNQVPAPQPNQQPQTNNTAMNTTTQSQESGDKMELLMSKYKGLSESMKTAKDQEEIQRIKKELDEAKNTLITILASTEYEAESLSDELKSGLQETNDYVNDPANAGSLDRLRKAQAFMEQLKTVATTASKKSSLPAASRSGPTQFTHAAKEYDDAKREKQNNAQKNTTTSVMNSLNESKAKTKEAFSVDPRNTAPTTMPLKQDAKPIKTYGSAVLQVDNWNTERVPENPGYIYVPQIQPPASIDELSSHFDIGKLHAAKAQLDFRHVQPESREIYTTANRMVNRKEAFMVRKEDFSQDFWNRHYDGQNYVEITVTTEASGYKRTGIQKYTEFKVSTI